MGESKSESLVTNTANFWSLMDIDITGYAGSKEDQVYSKVTGVIDGQSEQNKYIIRLTSAPLGARRFIRSMVEQD